MSRLTDAEKRKLCALIEKGEPLPAAYKGKLFGPEDGTFFQATKEYRLVYAGKTRREEVIADTPEAPLQLVRSFNADNPFPDKWQNMLIYGDNLLALKALYADQRGPNRYRTKDRIKLIYIDPPFATKQDFMKDREKAYRDKVIGAEFIEFLRKRLILLRELLADDGSIYVHLDWKKGHYIKAVLDEVFDETNFRNQIGWKRSAIATNVKKQWRNSHDYLLFYSRSDAGGLKEVQYTGYSESSLRHYNKQDKTGRFRTVPLMASGKTNGVSGQPWRGVDVANRGKSGMHWLANPEELERLDSVGKIYWNTKGIPELKYYFETAKGVYVSDFWDDISVINSMASEYMDYPTQKPEELLARIIKASSGKDDIVLDAFGGSGTTAAVAEKLRRRWISMDCGKLPTYTTQKRLFSLTTTVGAAKKDERTEPERVEDWGVHLKKSPGVFLVTERTRNGECEITVELLEDLAELIQKHNLVKKRTPFSLVCPKDKFNVPYSQLVDPSDDKDAGQKIIKVKGVEFQVSFIEPRQKPEKDKHLKAKSFALYNAGIYDNEALKAMPWADYRPFVLKLFQVREHEHFIKGFRCDGYVGTHSAFLWNYPEQKKLTIDYGYAESIHKMMGGSAGDRFYVIAPIVSMGFAEDEYTVGDTTYVFLKVPISILMRLLQSDKHGSLEQPTKEEDVNKVIDAVGFDFVSQPVVEVKCKKDRPPGELLKQYAIHMTEFRSKTLATDPEDFANFETFSMAMVDTNYDGETFKLSHVFWADNLVTAEIKRVKGEKKEKESEKGEGAVDLSACKRLSLRIAEEEFKGKQMMVIFCDRYGNEKKLVFEKKDFR
jgi:DNA modification methylase